MTAGLAKLTLVMTLQVRLTEYWAQAARSPHLLSHSLLQLVGGTVIFPLLDVGCSGDSCVVSKLQRGDLNSGSVIPGFRAWNPLNSDP